MPNSNKPNPKIRWVINGLLLSSVSYPVFADVANAQAETSVPVRGEPSSTKEEIFSTR